MEKVLNIVPKPQKVEILQGNFEFSANTAVECALPIVEKELFFLDFEKGAQNKIVFEKRPIGEDYTIEIGANVTVSASADEGLFHAAMTLKQLIIDGYENGVSKIPCARISDFPRYSHRGYMLDVSRHFFGIETVKKVIDALALAKINVFHWHLSDNQGFRIESEKFPKLVSVGSKRSGTRGDGVPVEGYYTKAQIREIVAYCAERYIEVIPEIDLPGHTIAVLAAYPELSCTGEKMEVAQRFVIDGRVLCPGKEKVYDFVFALLDEVCELFPSKYFHIGGDEVPKDRWKACEDCKRTMRDNNLKNTEELQGYFTNRIISHLKSLGKTAIVWNEAIKSGTCDESAVAQYWNDAPRSKHVIAAANAGRKIIVSKVFHFYLDYPYGVSGLKAAYSYEPEDIPFSEDGTRNVIGIEAPLWTEFVADEDRVFYMTFPRIYAAAERGWSAKEQNFDEFLERLSSLLLILQAYGRNVPSEDEFNPTLIDRIKGTLKFTTFWAEPKAARQAEKERKKKNKGE